MSAKWLDEFKDEFKQNHPEFCEEGTDALTEEGLAAFRAAFKQDHPEFCEEISVDAGEIDSDEPPTIEECRAIQKLKKDPAQYMLYVLQNAEKYRGTYKTNLEKKIFSAVPRSADELMRIIEQMPLIAADEAAQREEQSWRQRKDAAGKPRRERAVKATLRRFVEYFRRERKDLAFK
jgi:hypothetical protein